MNVEVRVVVHQPDEGEPLVRMMPVLGTAFSMLMLN